MRGQAVGVASPSPTYGSLFGLVRLSVFLEDVGSRQQHLLAPQAPCPHFRQTGGPFIETFTNNFNSNGAHGGALRPASSLYAWTQEGCLLSRERMVVEQPISPFNQIGEITPQSERQNDYRVANGRHEENSVVDVLAHNLQFS